ncbi:hypothetical protein LDENG_00142360 [Lucifuga dentata]|nr:hypothetical protein LDENG_00142360 [Lucifuga dentata]
MTVLRKTTTSHHFIRLSRNKQVWGLLPEHGRLHLLSSHPENDEYQQRSIKHHSQDESLGCLLCCPPWFGLFSWHPGELPYPGSLGFHVRRSVISIWIINLSVSDLLATASLPFFTLFMARGNTWTLGTTFCHFHSSIFFLNMFVSGFLLAAISLDRCLIVMTPVWAQNHRNIHTARKICGLIWVLALLCTIPFCLFRDTIPQCSGRIMCYYNYAQFLPAGQFDLPSLCERRQESLALMKLFLAFLIPLMIIIISYVIVTVRLKRRGWRRPFCFVRLVVAVVVCFIFCWAPYHFLSTLEALVSHTSPLQGVTAHVLPAAASVTFLNSVFNPILYVFSCPDLCSKIRHSLGAVMEAVLTEDLLEAAWRRSTQSYSGQKGRPSLPTVSVEEEQEHELTPRK